MPESVAMRLKDVFEGMHDPCDRVNPHPRPQRQRDDPCSLCRRDGVGLGPRIEEPAVERMEVQRNEMHACADASFSERRNDFSAVDPQPFKPQPENEQMPRVGTISGIDREINEIRDWGSGEGCQIR